jgi:predicted Fe-Mo cluster-binding NifX family protein
MDDRFGRAETFLVVDEKTGETLETIDNRGANSSNGAGPEVAAALHSAEVDGVISGRFGPKAYDALKALGIEAWIAPPGITAGEAWVMFHDGDLKRV